MVPISQYLRELRAVYGSQLVLMPGVAAVVRDDSGQILVERRSDNGQWGLPAGSIDPGETPAEAIIREVFEETGLHVIPTSVIGVFGGREFRTTYPNKDEVEYTVTVFDCEVTGGTLQMIDGESTELVWFDPLQLPYLGAPYPKEMFLHAKAAGGEGQWSTLFQRALPAMATSNVDGEARDDNARKDGGRSVSSGLVTEGQASSPHDNDVQVHPNYAGLVARIVEFASQQDDIRMVIITGSQARTTDPPDEWSDLDVILATTNTDRYLRTTQWLHELGNPMLTFIESTAVGDFEERRVLFEDGLDVDFSVIPLQVFSSLTPQHAREAASVFWRGIRVLVDKDHIADRLPPVVARDPLFLPPAEEEFRELVSDFLYHGILTAKKLRRGELWVAKSCLDGLMKRQTLTMMEWHAKVVTRQSDTWHEGRFLERWSDASVMSVLPATFARYDENDVWRALQANIDLFRKLADEVAAVLGFVYPAAADDDVRGLFREYMEGANDGK